MAENNQEANWVGMGLVLTGCVVAAIAIAQLLDEGAWIAIGIGAGLFSAGVVHALYTRKPR